MIAGLFGLLLTLWFWSNRRRTVSTPVPVEPERVVGQRARVEPERVVDEHRRVEYHPPGSDI
jgi:hypothetical protein